MRADNCYPLPTAYADVVIKTHYPHIWIRIVVLEYADAINNHIYIPFIYIYIYIFLISWFRVS
jgi:hypothetical protein